MSEYIDIDAPVDFEDTRGRHVVRSVRDVFEKNNAKWEPADMMEVICCKDCEFYMLSNFVDNHMECVRFNHPTTSNDFCSHGVKVRVEQSGD